MIFTVVFYIFVAVTIIQIIYFLSFSVFAFKKEKKAISNNIPISVIICVKNKANELADYIQEFSKQNYTDFEIVLINNASSDDTLGVMENLQQEYSNIKIVNVVNTEAFWGNRKYALTLGIKAATHEHLLFTDISCKPDSAYWIEEMSSNFSQEKSIILGYQKIKPKKLSFSNLLIRFDNIFNHILSFSFAKFGSPFSANIKNLGYTKSEFFKVNGFIKHMDSFLGEDDLFIKDAANNKNTAISIAENSRVTSNSYISFKDWFTQKRKLSIIFPLYKFKHRFFLNLFNFTKIIFFPLAVYVLIIKWKMALPIVLLYYFIQFLIIGKSAFKLHDKKILFLLPILDICLVSLQIIIFITNTISKPTHWK
ncbi:MULTISPECIES: glycosyltransferase [unclassified Tenacibaculum]|uniref:glycosyltransferase n=1 Tax=unclassified Tenacibaculum TaxID=2635139 RepID=UPI001F3B0061|nr:MULTISPECIES: glycosyltransferase [unclassified Tenacibaculum]MCF2875033.1 glycosyltransferase [Tenacibaculum sp. Cn5-1]MCF2935109.1 glycosyltransferase [Tenacibaculum sp. Cn5-34]MCG7511449.1 glycosyltransferase [Tenacibaculum sp. Cn5-46]